MANGFLRVTFDGMMTYYDRGFAYAVSPGKSYQCECNV
jgi:hypothetical protein